MSSHKFPPEIFSLLHVFSSLPKRIIDMYGAADLAAFVLYDLCGERCFNFNKAAFLVDNPDFNCLQGVAGFSRQEPYANACNVWDDPGSFSKYLQDCPFHQSVCHYGKCSIEKAPEPNEQLIQQVAHDLSFEQPCYRSFRLKNDNEGILIYECQPGCEVPQEYLDHSLYYLGFCPIV